MNFSLITVTFNSTTIDFQDNLPVSYGNGENVEINFER